MSNRDPTVGDHHHRGGPRQHCEEFGQQRLADVVHPLGVFDDEHGRSGTRKRRAIHQRRQSPPAGIRVDVNGRHVRAGDAEQVVEQLQVVGIGAGESSAHLRTCGAPVQFINADDCSQQARNGV